MNKKKNGNFDNLWPLKHIFLNLIHSSTIEQSPFPPHGVIIVVIPEILFGVIQFRGRISRENIEKTVGIYSKNQ